MAYTLKTSAGTILNGKTVLSCVLTDQDGTTITDLVGNTLAIDAGIRTGAGTWLSGGASIPYFAGGSGNKAIAYATAPAVRPVVNHHIYVITLGRLDNGGGNANNSGPVLLINAGGSAGVSALLWDGTNQRMGVGNGSSASASRTDNIPSASLPCAYYFNPAPFNPTALGQVVGGGASPPTALNTQTPTEGGNLTGSDVKLRSLCGITGDAYGGDKIALVLVLTTALSASEVTTLLADPIGAVAVAAAAAAVITGPSGAAGAANSTASVAEIATTGPLFSTDIALGSGFPTLTGTDASLFTLVSVGTNQWRVNPNPAKDFEAPADFGGNNVYDVVFNASASVSQACAITITNVAEGATFAGTLSVPTQTVGVAMANINAAAFFTAVDAGDTGTYSLDGGAVPGLSVASNGLTFGGTATAAGAYTARRIARLGSNGITVYSNPFSVTVNAGGDTTVPTLTGTLVATAITPTSYTLTASNAGADNVAVTSYERSVDGGATWVDVGNVLTANVTGRTPGSVDPCRWRAKDAAGNVSTPALAVSVPLGSIAPVVSTQPANLTVTSGATASFVGAFTGAPTPTLQWQEYIGSTWQTMSGQTAGTLALGVVTVADTGRQVRLCATNAGGGPVYTNPATLTVQAAPLTGGIVIIRGLANWANTDQLAVTIPFVKFMRLSDGVIVLELANRVTSAVTGDLTVQNDALVPGVAYEVFGCDQDGSNALAWPVIAV